MKTGFSLVEMTVAIAIVLVVAGAVFGLMDSSSGVFQSQPETIDTQQRLRVAVDALTRDLLMAGAGGGAYFAPVLPLRRGPVAPDPPSGFFDDRISILYVPAGAPQTKVRVATDAGGVVSVDAQAGCPAGDPLCGFVANSLVAVFDVTGAYDVFRVAAIDKGLPALVQASGGLSKSYPAGATVAGVVSATYWVRTASGTPELMKYDGRQTDLPVADEVTRLAFEYFGDPSPPELRRPLSDAAGPWTSYGPRPPDVGEDDAATPAYGPGENCLFTIVGAATVRRPEMLDLGSASPSLVPLDRGRLSDGPWCPDPTAPNRFDADLLRVRRVRVTIWLRPSRRLLRGPLADESIVFDVAPRNLSLRR